eukprot:CAMPEP_0184438532 /NCGR_PEP_ID=MMETSP0738-20130409/656132_1 /TAXON_ID=385413 /ORGANISM="Thalassiosira miniscula, Strain CCMP1093" /LENGTH=86 /DNA_ID=CAMNT_0026805883 /DNA_START=89 /DNA_END=346 /DNA_ORIENTATION=-
MLFSNNAKVFNIFSAPISDGIIPVSPSPPSAFLFMDKSRVSSLAMVPTSVGIVPPMPESWNAIFSHSFKFPMVVGKPESAENLFFD